MPVIDGVLYDKIPANQAGFFGWKRRARKTSFAEVVVLKIMDREIFNYAILIYCNSFLDQSSYLDLIPDTTSIRYYRLVQGVKNNTGYRRMNQMLHFLNFMDSRHAEYKGKVLIDFAYHIPSH